MDVIDATDQDPAHLHLRHVIAWPGCKYNKVQPGQPWHAKEPKGRHFRKVAISRDVHQRLLTYIDNWSAEPHSLVFDVGRLRAEHAMLVRLGALSAEAARRANARGHEVSFIPPSTIGAGAAEARAGS